MRKELELMRLIEEYLTNQLNAADTAAFETKMQHSADLRVKVAQQQRLMEGADRLALRQKAQAAHKSVVKAKWLKGIGLSAIVVGGLATALFFWNVPTEGNEGTEAATEQVLPALNEAGDELWTDADRYLESQYFVLGSNADTVLESEGGLILHVPHGAFAEPVTLEVKEALNAADIMAAGLSTTSNGELLETGGMFYINGRNANGETVTINPVQPISFLLPTDTKKEDMQLYEGKRQKDGTLNWENPVALENYLTTLPMADLDFYPPCYEDEVEKQGYSRKVFKDSLFYSFAFEEVVQVEVRGDAVAFSESEVQLTNWDTTNPLTRYDWSIAQVYTDSTTADLSAVEAAMLRNGDSEYYGINPASIKAIWNSDYDNTILATKAFERRLPSIYATCNQSVLDLYVEHLDWSMQDIDRAVVKLGYDEFKQFVQEGAGKVQVSRRLSSSLARHFKRKTKAYTKAIKQTQERFWKNEAFLDLQRSDNINDHDSEDRKRLVAQYDEELKINMTEAYRQLGMKKPTAIPISNAFYQGTVPNNGWNNVDRAVRESTQARTTLDYTDKSSGKKAVIKYEPITVELSENITFDRVYVYALPNKISSFQRFDEATDHQFTFKMNELLSYDVAVVGYVGDEGYFASKPNATTGSLILAPEKMDKAQMKAKLLALKPVAMNQVMKDLEFNTFLEKDNVRLEHNLSKYKLRRVVEPLVLPCSLGLAFSAH